MAPGVADPYTPNNEVVPRSPDEAAKYLLQEDAEDLAYQNKPLWRKIVEGLVYGALALCALFIFLVAIKLLGDGITLALGCDTKGAFDFADNPIAGLMIGTIATALIHSSSTVTSIVVALVGAGGMTVRQGVYVVMGANIGTCVTCIMVAFSQVGDRSRFERAMAAATVHDMYNIWSVIVMFPLEIIARPLERISVAMSDATVSGGEFDSPFDAVVQPLSQAFIVVDRRSIQRVATGQLVCKPGQSFLTDGFFVDSDLSDGSVGAIVASIGVVFLIVSLAVLVKMLAKVFLGPTRRIMAKMFAYNGYVNILLGTALTFAVQSSTLVTSTLTPMAGLGVITVEQVYPIVIGSNLGTTADALIAAMVTGRKNAVAIALVHWWFNTFGILLFYPIPITRKPIIDWSKTLARYSACWPMAAVIFLVMLFLVIPGFLLVYTYMCTADSTVTVVFGYILSAVTLLAVGWFTFWFYKKGGKDKWEAFLEKKRVAREATEAAKAKDAATDSNADGSHA